MSVVERSLKIHPSLVSELANWVIKKDVVRALVELITNSDDSYRKLAEKGIPGSGIIEVRMNRKHRNSIIEIIDHAEGFDHEKMDKCVGSYNFKTSGFMQGSSVRGFFGRGLKEAILALGGGVVESIVENHYYKCTLSEENHGHFKLYPPEKLNKKRKKEYEKELCLLGRGTKITLVVTKQDVSVPRFDTLAESLTGYYSLRDITTSKDRELRLVEIDEKGNERGKFQLLSCGLPIGKEVIDKDIIIPLKSGDVGAHLNVSIANNSLEQEGPCREGGILIASKHSIHDVSLFKFENDRYASKIFGRIDCPYIDDLLKNQEPIISDKRDGIEWRHELAISIKKTVEQEIEKIVEEIKKQEREKSKRLENERTRQRFSKAIEKLNNIALEELAEDIGSGKNEGKDNVKTQLPPNGFDFIPEYYQVVANKRSTLCLKLTVPYIIPYGTKVSIFTDNDDIEIVEGSNTTIDEKTVHENNIVTILARVVGKRIGAESIVKALAGDITAECYIKVVSKREIKEIKPRPRVSNRGLFSDIQYDQSLDPRIRHFFERETGVIKIATMAPSIKRYLGPEGEGQDELHCQVLVSELVIDSFSREIARRKAESNKLQYLGDDFTGAINKEINRLVFVYAHLIHSLLVELQAVH